MNKEGRISIEKHFDLHQAYRFNDRDVVAPNGVIGVSETKHFTDCVRGRTTAYEFEPLILVSAVIFRLATMLKAFSPVSGYLVVWVRRTPVVPWRSAQPLPCRRNPTAASGESGLAKLCRNSCIESSELLRLAVGFVLLC